MKPHTLIALYVCVLACSHESKPPASAYDSRPPQQSLTASTAMGQSEPDEPLRPASGVGAPRPTGNMATASDAENEPEQTGDNAGINQGETEADMALTLQVRQALLSDPALSFIAKSLTIITRDGRVTLRGLVNTPQERTIVERLARQVGPVRQVDNEVGVATE